jgi:hypothetical protein
MPFEKLHVIFAKDATAKFKEIVQRLSNDKVHVDILVGGQTSGFVFRVTSKSIGSLIAGLRVASLAIEGNTPSGQRPRLD